jgi:hypothetical protein
MLVPVRETVTIPMGAESADSATILDRWLMIGALVLLALAIAGFAVAGYLMRTMKSGQAQVSEVKPGEA